MKCSFIEVKNQMRVDDDEQKIIMNDFSTSL